MHGETVKFQGVSHLEIRHIFLLLTALTESDIFDDATHRLHNATW